MPPSVDDDLIAATVDQESQWNPDAESGAGAVGLGQLMPATARHYGVDPHDAVQNLAATISYLEEEKNYFQDDHLALAAYYTGRGNVNTAISKAGGSRDWADVAPHLSKDPGNGPTPATYVDEVMGRYQKRKDARLAQATETQDDTGSEDVWGAVPDFVTGVEDLATQPGFDNLPTQQKIQSLSRLYDSRKWIPEVDDVLKSSASAIWENASESERPPLAENAGPYLANIAGEDEAAIAESGEEAQSKFTATLKEGGVHPGIFGKQIDDLFIAKVADEQQRVAAKDRTVFGTVKRAGAEFLKGAAQGYTSAAAAIPKIAGFDEFGNALDRVPERLFGSTREFDYQIDAKGDIARDSAGEPVTRYSGEVLRGLGQISSLLAGGALLKGAGVGLRAVQGLIGGVNTLTALDAGYSETRAEGGSHEDGVVAAVAAAPLAVVGSLGFGAVLGSGGHWIAGLSGMNKTRAIATVMLRSGEAAAANLVTEAGIAGGASYATDENRFTTNRLARAAITGALPGAVFGALEARTTVGRAQPQAEAKPDPGSSLTPETKPQGLPPPPSGPAIALGPPPIDPLTQRQLSRELEKFQQSGEQRTIITVPHGAEIPKGLLDIFPGYGAFKLSDTQIEVIKGERKTPFREINEKNLQEVDTEIQQLVKGIDENPHPEAIRQLMAEKEAVKAQLRDHYRTVERSLDEDASDNSLIELRRETKKAIADNRAEYARTSDRTLRKISDLVHADLVNRMNQTRESLTTNPQRERAIELKERRNALSEDIRKLRNYGPFVDDLKQKENRINELSRKRSELVKEQSKFVEQDPFKEVAVKVETSFGPRYALHYQDTWHVLDDSGNVLTSGHWNLPDALHTARVLDNNFTPVIESLKPSLTERSSRIKGAPIEGEFVNGEWVPAKAAKPTLEPKPKKPGAKAKKGKEPPPDEESLSPDGESFGKTDGELGVAVNIAKGDTGRLQETEQKPHNIPVSARFGNASPHTKEEGLIRQGEKMVPITDLIEQGRKLVAGLKSGAPIGISAGGMIKRGYGGYFRFNKAYIRLKHINDAPTLAHEAAHAIDKAVLGKFDQNGLGNYDAVPPEVQQGLRDTSATYYGAPLATKNLQIAEGFSMFVEHYVTGQKVHSDVLNWFKNDFSKIAPKEYAGIEAFRDLAHEFYSQSSQLAVRSSRSAEPPSTARKFANFITEGLWKDDWVDSATFLGKLDKVAGSNVKNVFDSRRNTAGKTAEIWINDHLSDFNGNTIAGRSFREIVKPLEKDGKIDLLVDYMTAKRMKHSYLDQKLPAGAAPEDIHRVIEDTEANHRDVVDGAYAWWDAWDKVTEGMQQSSPIINKLISDQRAANLELTGQEHGFYVPFKREGREGEVKLGARIVGSHRTVENFLDHVQPQLRAMMESATRHHTLDYMFQVLGDRLSPTGAYGAKITDDVLFKQLDAEFNTKVAAALKKGGVESKLSGENKFSGDAETLAQAQLAVAAYDPQISNVKAPDGFTFVVHPEVSGIDKAGNPILKNEYYELPNRMWRVYDNRLPDWTSKPLFTMLFRGPKNLLQLGATVLRPAFILPNAARDLPTMYRRSNTTLNPLPLLKYTADALQQTALGKISSAKIETWYKKAQSLGLQGSTRASSEGYLNKLAEKKWKVIDLTEAGFGKIANVMSTLEEGFRLAAGIEKMNEMGVRPEDTLTAEQAMEFSLAYKRSTTDFAVQGRHAKIVNLAVPFFTARIAEVSQLGRDVREHPGKVAAIGLGWLTAGAYYALAHKDDDWYKEMDPKDRGQYFHSPVETNGEKRLLRAPLDNWSAMFFTMGQALSSNAYEKGHIKPSFAEFAFAVMKGTLPLNVSFDSLDEFTSSIAEIGGPVAKEYAQQKANRDFYFNKDIVPGSQKFEKPEDQYTAYTTELSKTIGSILGWSPERIEHGIRSAFPVGMDATHIVEDLTGVKRPKGHDKDSLTERMVARAAEAGLRYGLADDNFGRSEEKFYALLDKFQKNADQEQPEERKGRLRLNEIHTRVSAVNTVLREVSGDEDRKKLVEAKRELLNEAFAIAEGDTSVSLTAAPKGEAKRIKKEKAREKTEHREEKNSTVFEAPTEQTE